MKRLIALAVVLASSQASAATVEVATGKWDSLPYLKSRNLDQIGANAVGRVHEVIAKGECTLPGQTKRSIDLSVPFAIHFDPKGTPTRILVKNINCAPIERIMAHVLDGSVRRGEYRPSGENEAGWYQSTISFISLND